MAIEIVIHEKLTGRWKLELGAINLRQIQIVGGFRLARLSETQDELRISTLCAIPENTAQSIIENILWCTPTMQMLLNGHIKLQQMWVDALGRRYDHGFYGTWSTRNATLKLRWLTGSSVQAFHFYRDISDALFDPDSGSINSAIWVEGAISDERTFLGLIPLAELTKHSPRMLLESIERGRPHGFLAWKYSGMGLIGWRFPKRTSKPQRAAIDKTNWGLCDAPGL